jgi:hypothetical protein
MLVPLRKVEKVELQALFNCAALKMFVVRCIDLIDIPSMALTSAKVPICKRFANRSIDFNLLQNCSTSSETLTPGTTAKRPRNNARLFNKLLAIHIPPKA